MSLSVGGIGGPFSTSGTSGIYGSYGIQRDVQSNIDDPIKGTAKKEECQTCKNRKYVDGSDEMVSFKSPQKMSPERAASRVRAHEQEHVNNAYAKAATGDGKVLQASVSIKTAICPECGRSYICGGLTTTKIAYPKGEKENPYLKNFKSFTKDATTGGNFDKTV